MDSSKVCRHEAFDATVEISRDLQGTSLVLTALVRIVCRQCREQLVVDKSREPSFSEDGVIAAIPFMTESKIKLLPWKARNKDQTPTSSPPGHRRLSDG